MKTCEMCIRDSHTAEGALPQNSLRLALTWTSLEQLKKKKKLTGVYVIYESYKKRKILVLPLSYRPRCRSVDFLTNLHILFTVYFYMSSASSYKTYYIELTKRHTIYI